LGIREPSRAEPIMKNANGKPAILDRLPEGIRASDVRFELPVRLSGARLPDSVDAIGVAEFELFWRVEGEVPRSVGVLAYAMGPGGRVVRADHEVLAASLFFKHAPRDKLIRDAFSIYLGPGGAGVWKLYVGLWHASGDKTLVGVAESGGMRVESDQRQVGSFTVR
jgi:hypothetical protein